LHREEILTSVCYDHMLDTTHVGHVLYSKELSTELLSKMHSKISVFLTAITPRTSHATGSMLDMALRE